MRTRGLLWRMLPLTTALTLTILFVIGWHLWGELRRFYSAHVADDLEERACLILPQLPRMLHQADPAAVDELCKRLGREGRNRITVILPSGQVIGDSHEEPSRMNNHADRPEVKAALEGKRGVSVRYSSTLKQPMSYVALPVRQGNATVGVLRLSVPMAEIEGTLSSLRNRLLLAGVLIATGIVVMELLILRRLAGQFRKLSQAAERFARGDLSYRIPAQDTTEARQLALALNEMASRLDGQIRDLAHQRNEQEALLSSMVEGVVAIDHHERLIMLNRAAAELFEVDPAVARGRTLQETIRNPAVQQLAAAALTAEGMVETEIVLQDNGLRYLQAHGTPLRGVAGGTAAALIVLHDVTRLRKLESVRRDFVANVSHELRTPITSIKGFVETLRDGALDEPTDARRFLDIVAHHADRMNAIIEDLLALSRLEQEGGAPLQQCTTPVRPVLMAAIEACQAKAAERKITIKLACNPNLAANMDPTLIEQAIVNLITNAINYSPPGSHVRLTAQQDSEEITIRVQDQGCGIAPEHLPRIFERFYRVDKARSRDLGGTGLGLAIVKHIAQVHGGHVDVESTVGVGSTFCIHLPKEGPLGVSQLSEKDDSPLA
ncbi:MAG: two-component system histidine kinase PnpS [Candidatus Zipacnadales bacterium]